MYLTSSRILLKLNLYKDALQSDILICRLDLKVRLFFSYSDKLTIVSRLLMRRLHQDLIYTYKIILGLVDLDCSRFFYVSPNETTRGHVSKLFVRHSRVDVRKYFL